MNKSQNSDNKSLQVKHNQIDNVSFNKANYIFYRIVMRLPVSFQTIRIGAKAFNDWIGISEEPDINL